MACSVTTLIPVYGVGVECIRLIRRLVAEAVSVVVVDDGNPSGKRVVDLLGSVPKGVHILSHEVNRGKGAALKTGFRWILDNLSQTTTIVTADADGQHLPADILRVAEASSRYPNGLTIGVRSLPASVPFRSRFGNAWARMTFRLLTGGNCSDTQTGLRGIPRCLLPRLLDLAGERYDYELRMLAAASHFPAPIQEVPITTIYIEDNQSSHFRPLRDGLGTQLAFWQYCLARYFQRKGGT